DPIRRITAHDILQVPEVISSRRYWTTRKSSHRLGDAQETAEAQQPTNATDARF
ncbi:MAG: hypothetical protein EZS28_051559, partial [Streblomastix strix]